MKDSNGFSILRAFFIFQKERFNPLLNLGTWVSRKEMFCAGTERMH